MKKVLSLLFVALLAMSAWADVVVTVDFSQQGYNDSQQISALTVDDVVLTFDKGTNSNNPPKYFNTGTAIRLYGGNTMTVTAETNIKKIDFTFASGEGSNDILCDVGNYNKAGKQWTIGSSDPSSEVVFTIDGSSGHRRVQKLVITMEEANPVTELVPPVFNPNGGEFTGSLEVTLTCATENAEICYFEGEPDGDWTGWTYYNGPFYVTETKTYTAYSQKAGEVSDYVTVTFTKVEQTVEAPVFTPAAGSFYTSVNVTLTCATPGATIYYSLDNELWNQYVDPIPVTDDITIWAKAKVGDVESEVVSATYTKLPATTTDVTFDATVDKGDGDVVRHHYTVVKEPVTMYVGDGTVYTNHYRIYKSDTTALHFTSTGAPIIKIEFNGMSGYTASNLSKAEGNTGTWTTSGTDGVWEGNASFVEFKVNAQARFTTITVTLASQTPTYDRGDVNYDGYVTIDDVTTLINYLLTDAEYVAAADCNNDGLMNITDVTVLINFLLTDTWPEE
ncbi:MAG: chitobiase/beta-hexosaminidase C-terminal domain-containing protein [Muribaculaceae bacterium]|nr:chitobiase/beta-hexosaminidase C-terminal domain-containing protein [Muribaculaceae bacterium]